ncbi:MAG: tripartite tricarboxylate transporter substrate binding protein [Burkholderiales bacterium]
MGVAADGFKAFTMKCLFAFALLLASLMPIGAGAQTDWPRKPVQIVVPYGAGGAVDVMIRIFAEHMSQTLGQPVVILNRPGGNANIGPVSVAQAPADGYLLLASSGTLIVNPLIDANSGYTVRQFTPVARSAQMTNVVVVPASSKVTSLREFVAYARSNPDLPTNFSAHGNAQAVARESLAKAAGFKLLDVAYKGGTTYIPDLVAGRLSVSVAPINVVLPLIRDRQLTALAVTGERRAAVLPDVPTAVEIGFPGVVSVSWFGVHALTGTPKPVIERLAQAVRAAALDPKVQSRVQTSGAEVAWLDTTDFEAFLARETASAERYVQTVRDKDAR